MRAITRDGEYYGYSFALGSAEVSLGSRHRRIARSRAAALYANTLADDARVHRTSGVARADATFIVADMLERSCARAASLSDWTIT